MESTTAPQVLDRSASPELLLATIEVGPRELALLGLLAAKCGRVVTRTELATAAGIRSQAKRVDVHLVTVRRMLGEIPLVNVRGRGWMVPGEWRAAVQELADAPELRVSA